MPDSGASLTDVAASDKGALQPYLYAELVRFSGFRDTKETLAFSGLLVFLGAVGTVLVSKDWPKYAADDRELTFWGFTAFVVTAVVYIRYQLRRRRWAALRVAGLDWLLAEWLPKSRQAIKNDSAGPTACLTANAWWILLDHIWPQKRSVVVLDSTKFVYPPWLENTWLRAAARPTDAFLHEQIIQFALWVGYIAASLRIWFAAV